MLTIAHKTEVEAHHALTLLPSWHTCHKYHGHLWTITLKLIVPAAQVSDEDSAQLRVAAAELESIEGPLRMKFLGNLVDPPEPRADRFWLARWAHGWTAARLREGLGDYLQVTVELPNDGPRPSVHRGSAVPEAVTA